MEGTTIEADQIGIVINENKSTGDVIANSGEVHEQHNYYGLQGLLNHKIENYNEAITKTKDALSTLQEEKSNLDGYMFKTFLIGLFAFGCQYVSTDILNHKSAQHVDVITFLISLILYTVGFGSIIHFARKKDENDGTKYKRWKWLSYEIKASKELMVEFYKAKVTKDICDHEAQLQQKR
jgi:hypothetical protein